MEDKVFCGSEKVTIKEKMSFVNTIFSDVSKNYNLMNDVMSFGMHRCWKKEFISLMNQYLIYKNNSTILDVASGTGDIAINFLKQNKNHTIILSDINEDMLQVAKNRIFDENLFHKAEFIVANAANLPLSDSAIDLYTISFGIRNVSEIKKALDEAYRVLKPYGTFMCMEFSPTHNENGFFSKCYDLYSEKLIPFFGEKIAQNREAYKYLVDSIKSFYNKEEFKILLENTSFKNTKYISLNFGLVAIHIGQKTP